MRTPASESTSRRQALRVFGRSVVIASALGALVCACTGEHDKQVLSPVVLGMLETTAPAFDDGQDQIFQVTREVRLPYRSAKDGERPRGELDPYPRIPFHLAANSRVTIRFTLSNLEDKEHSVELLVDPWNEFVRYVPGVANVREDEVMPNFSGIQRIFVLPPKARLEGIITPDDMVELATDLTVAMALERRPPAGEGAFAGPVLFNRTFNIQNRSSEPDLVLASWMPADRTKIAAVTGFDLGLRTSEPARIAVELVVDVDDLEGDRVIVEGEEGQRLGRPGTELTPPAGQGPM